MPTWESICNTVNHWTDKVNAAAEDLADRTALQIKLSTRRSELEKEYTTLGKLTYRRLYSADAEIAADTALTEQINRAISRITAISAEIAEIEKQSK